jgi:hypothetical protein
MRVADTIISFSVLDEWRIKDVFDYFAALDYPERPPVVVQDAGCGGRYALQHTMLIGAFNYLDIDALVAFLEGLEWYLPDDVQLLIADEHDEPHIFTERLHRERMQHITENKTLGLFEE